MLLLCPGASAARHPSAAPAAIDFMPYVALHCPHEDQEASYSGGVRGGGSRWRRCGRWSYSGCGFPQWQFVVQIARGRLSIPGCRQRGRRQLAYDQRGMQPRRAAMGVHRSLLGNLGPGGVGKLAGGACCRAGRSNGPCVYRAEPGVSGGRWKRATDCLQLGKRSRTGFPRPREPKAVRHADYAGFSCYRRVSARPIESFSAEGKTAGSVSPFRLGASQ